MLNLFTFHVINNTNRRFAWSVSVRAVLLLVPTSLGMVTERFVASSVSAFEWSLVGVRSEMNILNIKLMWKLSNVSPIMSNKMLVFVERFPTLRPVALMLS